MEFIVEVDEPSSDSGQQHCAHTAKFLAVVLSLWVYFLPWCRALCKVFSMPIALFDIPFYM